MDYGTGWEQVTTYKNKLQWSNSSELNPAISRVTLTGSVSFLADDYDNVMTFKNAGNLYIPILVQQYDGAWNDIYEGNADLRSSWDENIGLIELSKFNNGADQYDNIISNYKIKYGWQNLGLGSYVTHTQSDTSITIDAVLVAGTGLSPAAYKLAYLVTGTLSLIPTIPDPRWAYFLFRSTNGDGSHNFETMSFDYNPNDAYGYTYVALLYNGSFSKYWVKLPPSVGASETLSQPVAYTFHRFYEMIGELLSIASSVVTLNPSTAVTYTGQSDVGFQYSWFNFHNYQIGEAAEISAVGAKGSEISLFDTFEIMRTAFSLFWYIDGTELKFKHASELTTSGTLDLTSQTEHLKRLKYVSADEIPDVEVFELLDSQGVWEVTSGDWGIFQIYYRNSNLELAKRKRNVNKINISTNVRALLAGEVATDKNNFALLETVDDTSIPRTLYGAYPFLNGRLSAMSLYGHLNKWRYGSDVTIAGRFKVLILSVADTQSRPLLSLPPVSSNISLLTDYDMGNEILTSVGSAKTKVIKQNLSSDELKITLEL